MVVPPELRRFAKARGVSATQLEALWGYLRGEGQPERGGDAPTQPTTVGGPSGQAVTPEAAPSQPGGRSPPLPSRYRDLGPIGSGGMGEVRRVLDTRLNRSMAMKLIRAELLTDPAHTARFLEEAQLTAQLQHPGVVPVHDVGHLDDGRLYFTMKEITGRSLRYVISELHTAAQGGAWRTTPSGWTFRGLLDAFKRVCEAVAYAHARGVIHRDLKPANIMLGAFGEVLVLDWGVASVLGTAEPGAAPPRTSGIDAGAASTEAVYVAGSLAWMPPEQAWARADALGPASDVYALGAVLYALLSGRAPYVERDRLALTQRILAGPPDPLEKACSAVPAAALPEALTALCRWAMDPDPARRPADAGVLAVELGAFLEGARRQEEADGLVRQAAPLGGRAGELRARARALRLKAGLYLARVNGWEPIERKRPGWALEAQALDLEVEAALHEVTYVQGLRAALAVSEEHAEAHRLLAEHYKSWLIDAEARREPQEAAQAQVLLQAHDRAGLHAGYLRGDATLDLSTTPPGARVVAYPLVERERRLVPGPARELGPTPLRGVCLPHGSYLLHLSAPGCEVVRLPVALPRGGAWRCVSPDGRQVPIPLPALGGLPEGACYVPAGWFQAGGDPNAFRALPAQQVWIDGLLVQAQPVTNRAYLTFLNDLVKRGLVAEALLAVPRERGGTAGQLGAMIYGRDARGRFHLRADADGDTWLPEHPVVQVDRPSALAYARWYAARTGLPWRLPWELEWEKAGRGVDGRHFVWGDFCDPTWACLQDSREGRPTPVPVGEFEDDVSVYGVRGLSGNVQDWCLDVYDPRGPKLTQAGAFDPTSQSTGGPDDAFSTRGGAWYGPPRLARLSNRGSDTGGWRCGYLGFRLVADYPPRGS